MATVYAMADWGHGRIASLGSATDTHKYFSS